MKKYSLLTKSAKCKLNIALKLTFSVFLFFFVFWLHFRPPRHCLRPFFERQFFTVERREEKRREKKVGKPLLTGSALDGDWFRDICDMDTIPPETQFSLLDTVTDFSLLTLPLRGRGSQASRRPLTVEQFDPASPCRFEIVDLMVGVRCRSALDSPSQGRVLSTSLAI